MSRRLALLIGPFERVTRLPHVVVAAVAMAEPAEVVPEALTAGVEVSHHHLVASITSFSQPYVRSIAEPSRVSV